ncbi:MAG: hypothetical protein LBJ31_05315 [Treponema sp.]|jgi:hypothetical protein|nr:hypothetical protein [Treponema sp.]
MKEILKIFQKIEWEKLHSASKIENINENFRDLISEETEISERAYWKFDNVIVLQGDLYEAAFYIIPFLLKLLEKTKNIEKILNLLFEISNGSETKHKGVHEYQLRHLTKCLTFRHRARYPVYYLPAIRLNRCEPRTMDFHQSNQIHLYNNLDPCLRQGVCVPYPFVTP